MHQLLGQNFPNLLYIRLTLSQGYILLKALDYFLETICKSNINYYVVKLQIKQIKLINVYVICSQKKAFLKGFKSCCREISSNIDPDHSYRPRKNFPRMIPITTPVRKISQNDPDHGTISRENLSKGDPDYCSFQKDLPK